MDTNEERRNVRQLQLPFSDSINYFSSSSRLVFLLLLLIYKLIYDQLILFCRCVVGFTHHYTLAAITRSPRPLWPSHRTCRDIACKPSDQPTCQQPANSADSRCLAHPAVTESTARSFARHTVHSTSPSECRDTARRSDRHWDENIW